MYSDQTFLEYCPLVLLLLNTLSTLHHVLDLGVTVISTFFIISVFRLMADNIYSLIISFVCENIIILLVCFIYCFLTPDNICSYYQLLSYIQLYIILTLSTSDRNSTCTRLI